MVVSAWTTPSKTLQPPTVTSSAAMSAVSPV
jgi:hypothetical protein